MTLTTNKYNSVIANLGRALPAWVDVDDDKARIAAYDAYADMYANVPTTFQVVMRGEEDRPIYIPSSQRIIEATNRYLGKDWNWGVLDISNNDANRTAALKAINDLMTREEIRSKFFSLKRTMLIKGDALLHITINPAAPQGLRLSIDTLDPRTYFRIPSPTNDKRTIGCYLITLMYADDGTTQISQRIEYRFNDDGTVFTRMTFWEPDGWDDRFVGHKPLKPTQTPAAFAEDPALAPLLTGFNLPRSVKALPVYHVRNNRDDNQPFGGSQLAGMETIIAGINQGASDEDITLALQGLGLYVTDSPPPVTSSGEETDWLIQPGYVLELKPGQKFDRVSGVAAVTPFQDHLKYLGDERDEASGLSSVAIGNVDVSSAPSGIALRLNMAPILAANEEKEVELLSRLDVFFHDLTQYWMPMDSVGVTWPNIMIINSFGDPLPIDRAAIIAEVVQLVTAQLMSREFAIKYLTSKLGYQFPADMLDNIIAEQDAIAARFLAEEAGTGGGTGSETNDIAAGGGTAPDTGSTTPSAPAAIGAAG